MPFDEYLHWDDSRNGHILFSMYAISSKYYIRKILKQKKFLFLLWPTLHPSFLFITRVRFHTKKNIFETRYTCVNITPVRFISQVIFIQKGSCQEVSYIFAKVIPVSKSLLFSRVSKHPSATIFKWFIHKATKHTSIFAP